MPDEYEPLLVLSTEKKKRPCIEVDGKDYELKRYAEFGLADQHQLTRDGETFDELWAKPVLTKKEGDRLEAALERMYDKVFIAPPKVKASLDPEQRAMVATTFTLAPLQMAARRAAKTARELQERAEELGTQEPETPAT